MPTFVDMAGWVSAAGLFGGTGVGTTIPPPCISEYGLPGASFVDTEVPMLLSELLPELLPGLLLWALLP